MGKRRYPFLHKAPGSEKDIFDKGKVLEYIHLDPDLINESVNNGLVCRSLGLHSAFEKVPHADDRIGEVLGGVVDDLEALDGIPSLLGYAVEEKADQVR